MYMTSLADQPHAFVALSQGRCQSSGVATANVLRGGSMVPTAEDKVQLLTILHLSQWPQLFRVFH